MFTPIARGTSRPRAPLLALVLLLVTACSPATASPLSTGITGDPCTDAAQCKGTRRCFYIDLELLSSDGDCNGRDQCVCVPSSIQDLQCTTDADCQEPGEVCATLLQFNVSGCVSLATVDQRPELSRTDPELDAPVVPGAPEPSPDLIDPLLPGFDDFQGAVGTDESEMGGPETGELETGEPETDGLGTDEPETDGLGTDEPETDGLETDEPEPSASAESDAVCIAVQHLRHLSSDQLLFPSHVRASVLCDAHRNCATPGHIVHFEGRFMMMKSYCAFVGCETDVQLVNSPKYVPKLRLSSRSKALQFTSFAARYGSGVEERMLQVALRLGL